MSTPVERVLAAVADPPVLGRGDPLVVLVSGGRDSVCLLDVAVTICGPDRLVALHVNYGLRGADSDADEEHVARLCRHLGVQLDVVRPPAAPVRGNVQAWARDLRYGEAVSRARDRRARVAAGHTATDQVETILYRLAASPGRRALLGMARVDGLLIRPLLGVTRELTGEYCVQRRLDWRDDATNADQKYARSRCRHGLAAALAELHPAAAENISRTADLLRDEAAVLDEVVTTALAGRDRIALARLAELPPGLARLVVIRLAENAAGRLVPGIGARVPELLRLAPRGGSARLDVGGGARAVVEYGVLRVESATDGSPLAPAEVRLPVPGSVRFGAWQVDCEVDPTEPGPLDADVLDPAGLTVRAWRAGDRIAPIGLGGTKTLADLFVDNRIPRAARRTLPIVACGHEIAWVPGLAIGERFGVSPRTTRTLVLRAHAVPQPADPDGRGGRPGPGRPDAGQ